MMLKNQNLKKLLVIVGLILAMGTLILNERIATELLGIDRGSIPQTARVSIVIVDVLFAVAALLILVQHKSKTKILVDAGVGLGFTLVLLLGMEGVFYYLNAHRQRQLGKVVLEFINDVEGQEVQFKGEHAQAFFKRDEWLGYKPIPGMQVRASRKNGERILYDVIYTADAYGRRVVPMADPDARPYFILFFGDSFTFGEGVNDDETMPFHVSQLAPQYKPYNYAVGGYGPQHMLAHLQRQEIRAEVEETEGILIYTFLSEHVFRVAGSMRIHNQRGDVMPYYHLDSSGGLIREGNFVSGRPLLSRLYWLAGYSQTLLYFNIDFPPRLRDQDVKTTVKIIEEARKLYQQKFNSDRFVVIIYPTLGVPEMLPYLEAADIPYLDYSDLPEAYNWDFWIGEGHPAAKAHQIVSEKLVEDLDLADARKE